METRPLPGAPSLAWARGRALNTDALLIAAILLVCAAVYILSPVTTSTDSAWTFHVAASILRQGNVDLDEYRGIMDPRGDYRMREAGGHIYYYYPAATPLLVTPAVWLINKIYPLAYSTDFYTYLAMHAPNSRTAKLEKVLASGIAALAGVLVYLLARRELTVGPSLALTAIFAFATSMWSTASRALWQHGPSALLLGLALCLLFRADVRPRLLLVIGVLLGFSYLVRPTNALAVGFIGLFLLLNQPRRVWLYVLGLAAVLVPYVAQNWLSYGNIFPPYSYQLFERLASPPVFAEGLAGTLISPARGLFIFTPVLLFSLCGIYLRLRGRLTRSNLDLYLVGILVAHWVVISLFEDWGGAWSIGSRYFVDVLPLFVYFLIPVARSALPRQPGWRYAFAATLVFSVLVQLHCSTSIDPFMWNGKPVALVEAPERKWDWGDLQFLRGFCANDPLEGRAPACWFGGNG